jgi:hypothetical protein
MMTSASSRSLSDRLPHLLGDVALPPVVVVAWDLRGAEAASVEDPRPMMSFFVSEAHPSLIFKFTGLE